MRRRNPSRRVGLFQLVQNQSDQSGAARQSQNSRLVGAVNVFVGANADVTHVKITGALARSWEYNGLGFGDEASGRRSVHVHAGESEGN